MTFHHQFIWRISFIAALGGYLFGFDFAVIAGALPFLQAQFHLDPTWEGFATGSLALGAIAGCLVAGRVADRYGRRPAMLLAAAIFALSSLAMAFAPSRLIFIAARFVAGSGVGMASMLSPMYIAEIAPAKYRGRMVAINQLTVVLGILITNLVNYALRNEGVDAWRWMFGLGVVPAGLFILGAYFLPESPRWLVKKGRDGQAAGILRKVGSDLYAETTLAQMKASGAGAGNGGNGDSGDNRSNADKKANYKLLLQKAFFPILLVGIGLAVFQQLCGINTVFNYAPKIFESIGASKDDQLLQTVFIGGVNLVFTIFAMLTVDRFGRRPLMLFGAGGLAIIYVFIVRLLGAGSAGVSWFLLAAIGLYAMSLAPVTWVLISEIFPTRVRDAGISVAVICLWVAYFILVFTFPILFEYMQDNTFYIYAVLCALGFLFILLQVKETKGKTLEQLDQQNR